MADAEISGNRPQTLRLRKGANMGFLIWRQFASRGRDRIDGVPIPPHATIARLGDPNQAFGKMTQPLVQSPSLPPESVETYYDWAAAVGCPSSFSGSPSSFGDSRLKRDANPGWADAAPLPGRR